MSTFWARTALCKQRRHGSNRQPIILNHRVCLESLGNDHRDPFDRLLIAQATKEGIVVVTKDVAFQNDDVTVVWN